MKTPELYVGDVLVAIEAIDFAAHSLTQSFLAKSKALKRRSFFMPWNKNALSNELLASGNFAIARLGHLQSIREKLMQSTGVDEDMRPITLEEILKKNATRTN
jgi:hypothetical protein